MRDKQQYEDELELSMQMKALDLGLVVSNDNIILNNNNNNDELLSQDLSLELFQSTK